MRHALRRASALPPGGWLAIQVPGNFDAPSHTLLRELAASPRFSTALEGVLRPQSQLASSDYGLLLLKDGLTVDVWETTYLHVLAGPRPVLAWMRGAALRPVLGALSPSEGEAFCEQLAELLDEAYPATPFGTLLPFRRIFAVGHRS